MKTIDEYTSDVVRLAAEKKRRRANMRSRAALICLCVMLLAGTVLGTMIVLKPAPEPVEPTPTDLSPEPTDLPPEPTGATENSSLIPAAALYIDVNPSVKITLDKDKKVLGIIGLNEDAKAILPENEGAGETVGGAVREVITLIKDHGYLGRDGVLLLSAESSDRTLAKAVLYEARDNAEKVTAARIIASIALTSENIYSVAEELGVSPCRARYILKFLNKTDEYTADELATMPIKALIELCDELEITVDGYIVDVEYDEAVTIALEDAGYSPDEVEMLYEGELLTGEDCRFLFSWVPAFRVGEKVFLYFISSETGEIVEKYEYEFISDEQAEKIVREYVAEEILEIYPEDLNISPWAIIRKMMLYEEKGLQPYSTFYVHTASGYRRIGVNTVDPDDILEVTVYAILNHEEIFTLIGEDLGIKREKVNELRITDYSKYDYDLDVFYYECFIGIGMDVYYYRYDMKNGELLEKELTEENFDGPLTRSYWDAILTARRIKREY